MIYGESTRTCPWGKARLLGKIFKKKSEIPQNDLTKPNIEGISS